MNPAADAPSPRPWGPWLSLLFGAVLFLAYSTAQGLGLVPMILLHAAGGTPPGDLAHSAVSGFNLALATFVGCPVMVLLCGLLAWARRGPSLTDYLAVHPLTPKQVGVWTGVMILAALAFSGVNDLLQRPPPEFIVSTYATAGYLPLLWAAIALAAPLAEEVWMRGFVFAGLAASRLGTTGTILVTSFFFAIVHAGQYEWIDLTQIGLVGVLLGLARARTGSIVAPLAMHMALNLTSLTLYATSPHAAVPD